MYYSYITSFAVDESSASIISKYSSSANFGGTPPATFSEYGTATPQGTSYYRNGFYPFTHTSSIGINGPALTYDSDEVGQNNLFYLYAYKRSSRNLITTRTISINPFKEVFFAGTFSGYTTRRGVFVTSDSTTDSTSYTFENGTYSDWTDSFFLLHETYSYTEATYIASTSEYPAESYIYLDDLDFGSTTYPIVASNYVETTQTYYSTRNATGSFFLAPKNITISANLEFLFNNFYTTTYSLSPMLKAFFSTKNSILISDCDALLNETISTTFSMAGLERSAGAYASSPKQTVYLTTNQIGYSKISTIRTLYSYEFITTKQNETLYYLSSYTQNKSYLSFFEISGISTYLYGGIAGSAYNSAYSHTQTITIPTTTFITDISCNIFSTFSLLKSLTISTTATVISADQVLAGVITAVDSGATLYANPSFFPVSLYMAYSGFLSSSTQEILLGNFIKNVTDKTAYDNINHDACAGIIGFTANGSRRSESSEGEYYITYGARYHRYDNCTAFLYRDPLTSSIESVTISQNVSSFYGSSSGTSISQTINWISGALNSSASRSFEVLYTDSRGTSSWTFDIIADNDNEYFSYSSTDGGWFFTGFPAVSILPENIFATYGQGKNANYMANGAYFKSDSSAFEFVTTTYSNPISIENDSNNFSRVSVFTAGHLYNTPLVMPFSLRELY